MVAPHGTAPKDTAGPDRAYRRSPVDNAGPATEAYSGEAHTILDEMKNRASGSKALDELEENRAYLQLMRDRNNGELRTISANAQRLELSDRNLVSSSEEENESEHDWGSSSNTSSGLSSSLGMSHSSVLTRHEEGNTEDQEGRTECDRLDNLKLF
ncbi:hypothetical protein R1sor_004418 [Riccia sorocarpa]|uniref:Uncharacterized protein n=1 Tax=Riccia sorocarpa TaxID=122646 RepID=A0ABD3HGW8_9MARC